MDDVEPRQYQEADPDRQPHVRYLVRVSGASARNAGSVGMVGLVHDHVSVGAI
jgi:hypothetical protein